MWFVSRRKRLTPSASISAKVPMTRSQRSSMICATRPGARRRNLPQRKTRLRRVMELCRSRLSVARHRKATGALSDHRNRQVQMWDQGGNILGAQIFRQLDIPDFVNGKMHHVVVVRLREAMEKLRLITEESVIDISARRHLVVH